MIRDQLGGYNICDNAQPFYFIPKLKMILSRLENNDIHSFEDYNNISNIFFECYDFLMDNFYSKNEYYYQTMDDIKSSIILDTTHINYSALLLISFLVELHIFLLIYSEITDIEYINGIQHVIRNKPVVNYDTKNNQKNKLLRIFGIDETIIYYKDKLKINLKKNKNITKTLDTLCNDLKLFTNEFFNNLITNIENQYFTYGLKTLFCLNDNFENIYYDWRSKFVIKICQDNETMYDSTLNNIYLILTQLFHKYAGLDLYDADIMGMFNWAFVDSDNNLNHGSCETSTFLEHYILNLLHFKSDTISLILQNERTFNCKQHTFWTFTMNSIKDEIKKEYNLQYFLGISHWATSIQNDIVTINNKKINNTNIYRLRHVYTNDFFNYKKISLFSDKYLYFKAFIYPLLDNQYQFIIHNITKKKMDDYNFNAKLLLVKISEIHEYFQKKIKDCKNNEKNIYIQNIKKTKYNNNENIVDLIKFGINKFKIPNYEILSNISTLHHIEIPINNNMFDPKEPLKDIATKFVTKNFYNTKKTTIKFYNLINTIFTQGIQKYIDEKKLPEKCINFIFKGGNILKLITESSLSQLPKITKRKIKEIIQHNFSKSDADFQINIKNLIGQQYNNIIYREEHMIEIENEITTISYLLLYRIRNIILSDINNYTDYFILNQKQQKILLNEILNDFNNIDNLQEPLNNVKFVNIYFDGVYAKNISNDEFVNEITNKDNFLINKKTFTRKDFSITTNNINTQIIEIPYLFSYSNLGLHDDNFELLTDKQLYLNNDSTPFYISINKTIEIFNLARMKINFMAEYKKNDKIIKTSIPGEYIDVVIMSYKDSEKYFNVNNISEFALNENENNIKFLSYSINYFIEDFTTMLFKLYELPWKLPKYEKRYNRYILLLYINLLELNIEDNAKHNILHIIKLFFKSLKESSELNLNNVQIWNRNIIYFKNKLSLYDNNIGFINLINKCIFGNIIDDNYEGLLYKIKNIVQNNNDKPEELKELSNNFDKFIKINNYLFSSLATSIGHIIDYKKSNIEITHNSKLELTEIDNHDKYLKKISKL